MLTIEQFKCLPHQEQLTYIWENCVFLKSRTEANNLIIKLYFVGQFFVEIRFYSADQFQIIQAFESTNLLLPYVEAIDLSELLA